MSEAIDKVRGVRELPLFPLPVVLFPGVPLPLHIFEPRYRKMLVDIRAGDNLFGLSFFDADSSDRDFPPAGHIGCVAEVTETQALPDGRSNVLAVGVVRYQVEEYIEQEEGAQHRFAGAWGACLFAVAVAMSVFHLLRNIGYRDRSIIMMTRRKVELVTHTHTLDDHREAARDLIG